MPVSRVNTLTGDEFWMGQLRYAYRAARRSGADAYSARSAVWTVAFATSLRPARFASTATTTAA